MMSIPLRAPDTGPDAHPTGDTFDARAFEALVLAYAEPLTIFAWRYVRSADAARDLVQDVFASMWEQRDTLVVRGSVKGYLYATVRNRALNAAKHAAVEERWRVAAGRVSGDATARPASDVVERAELASAVMHAFGSLGSRAREVARLWFIDELSHEEIAQTMGMTVAAVGNQVSRIGRRLRGLLSGVWP